MAGTGYGTHTGAASVALATHLASTGKARERITHPRDDGLVPPIGGLVWPLDLGIAVPA